MFKYCVKALFLVSTVCCGCCFGEVLRDPTRPLGSFDKRETPLQLHSVLIGATRKVAIINGKSLHEGDAIPGYGGFVVEKINAKRVLISENGTLRSLLLSLPLNR